MKKLFMLLAVGMSLMALSQQTDQEKLKSILDAANKNIGDKSKVDSLMNEAKSLLSSNDIAVKIMAPEVVNVLQEAIDAGLYSKPIKTKFDNLSKEDKKNFIIDEDKFRKIAFIKPKMSGYDRIVPYFSVRNNNVTMRLKTKYNQSGWLFFNRVIFLIDGESYEYSAGVTDRNVVSGSNVSEVSDITVDNTVMSILRKIAQSPNQVEFRLTGDKYQDFKLVEREKEKIKMTLDLYDKMIN